MLAAGDGLIPEDDDDDEQPDIVLLYNSVHGYVSAITELWAHQTSRGLHNALQPHRVAIKALKTAIARGEHTRRRTEFADCGVSTMLDGYVALQILDLHRQVWAQGLGRGVVEQALRTQLDFLLGNSMLLRMSNRSTMELPDLFPIDLPKEGPKGDTWCLVAVMDHGKYSPFYSTKSKLANLLSQARQTSIAGWNMALPSATETTGAALLAP
ncbi:MAG TPA: hypothetical protein VIY29_23460 [Ktedonobacteraceae bacterium]